MIITINNKNYAKHSYFLETYGITSDRLKKWRLKKGAAKNLPLDFLLLDGHNYLYNVTDIELLVNITELDKIHKVK